MNRRVCLTPEEAFEAGFNDSCQHDQPDPNDCPRCRLTDAEIGRLVVLLQGAYRPQQSATTAA
ncbi:hypothetical protein [Streptomyces sp. S.PB5]|uniref:hypothetical protein n=1 Tax=Streptomyces sp. S.PB5 TaxID=3020844 RepID=UPI0025B02B9C|nr:hypothetical protein [Streptomyces sp. S.PB5]MDN3021570.1 hypothetical protein [Streptomyces sp. S.PB5]